jgi:hypothetical protein
MTGKILKELPLLCIQYLTQFFNAILLRGYFPTQWKVAQIIFIPKPGKPPHQLSCYRTIRLLPIVSKSLKKFFSNASFRYLNMPTSYLIISSASDRDTP